MAQLGQLPQVGDAVQVDVSEADAENDPTVRVELRVRELDGRRAAAIVVHRLDDSDSGSRVAPQS
jgi:hypothetical protein